MSVDTLAQLEHISQQITQRLRHLDHLIDEAWLEHELLRGSLRDFLKTYHLLLGKEGISYTT